MTMTVNINLDVIPFNASTIAANVGVFALTGFDALSGENLIMTADNGAFALDGQDASLTEASSLTLIANNGSFALAGQDAEVVLSLNMIASNGSFTFTGQSAGLLTGNGFAASAGVFALNGQDAGLLSSIGIVADSGSLSLTGQDAGTNISYVLLADAGAFALSGQDVTFVETTSATIVADSGAFALTGQDVATSTSRLMLADNGAFALSGQDAELSVAVPNITMIAAQGSFAFTGQDATLTVTGGGVVWDISGGTFLQAYAPAQANNPADVIFSSDGLKMILLNNANDRMYEYDLSTAWDVSTATYTGNLFSVATQENNPRGLSANADGTIFYVAGLGSDAVFQYDLSTGFDLSTISYASKTLSVSTNTSVCLGGTISADGNHFYTIQNGAGVRQYDLSTSWDISTGSYVSSFSTSSETSVPYGVRVSPDGSQMLVNSNLGVFQYTLATAWDISSATYDSVTLDTSSQETGMTGLFISTDATKLYVVGTSNDDVYEYDL